MKAVPVESARTVLDYNSISFVLEQRLTGTINLETSFLMKEILSTGRPPIMLGASSGQLRDDSYQTHSVAEAQDPDLDLPEADPSLFPAAQQAYKLVEAGTAHKPRVPRLLSF